MKPKAQGFWQSQQMLEYFIDKSWRNFDIVLCFSPIGDLFGKRARKFPGFISCTIVDWFHPWPREASKTRNSILLSLVTPTLFTPFKCPCKTISCLFSKGFHILIVLSKEQGIIYLLSLVTPKLFTLFKCPCKTASCLFFKKFQILIVLSQSQKQPSCYC